MRHALRATLSDRFAKEACTGPQGPGPQAARRRGGAPREQGKKASKITTAALPIL